eukprot:COSAG06_NODE_11542_length_1494_cov_10.518996_1_plen_242_part_00
MCANCFAEQVNEEPTLTQRDYTDNLGRFHPAVYRDNRFKCSVCRVNFKDQFSEQMCPIVPQLADRQDRDGVAASLAAEDSDSSDSGSGDNPSWQQPVVCTRGPGTPRRVSFTFQTHAISPSAGRSLSESEFRQWLEGLFDSIRTNDNQCLTYVGLNYPEMRAEDHYQIEEVELGNVMSLTTHHEVFKFTISVMQDVYEESISEQRTTMAGNILNEPFTELNIVTALRPARTNRRAADDGHL